MKRDLLFDLDGTLTDPADGITASVANALRHMGYEVPARSVLESFIGPPLSEGFAELYGFTPQQTDEAVRWFREYFTEKGIFENEIFPGVPEMLETLQQGGHRLFVATSKPEVFARRILQHFGIDGYFEDVVGSPMEGHGLLKSEIVRQLLHKTGVQAASAVMVGDRKHDMMGAVQNGLVGVGVTYGYGSREELLEHGAHHVVGTVEELGALLKAL